jgi:predicted GIY-YIG superfamily endonuclease
MKWYTYILKCSDESFYIGHAQNVEQRVARHNAGQGAIFTKHRRPVNLVYEEVFSSKQEAVVRELQLKKWSRAKKQALIDGDKELLKALSRRHG